MTDQKFFRLVKLCHNMHPFRIHKVGFGPSVLLRNSYKLCPVEAVVFNIIGKRKKLPVDFQEVVEILNVSPAVLKNWIAGCDDVYNEEDRMAGYYREIIQETE